jgi:hypothetical protein
MECPATVFSSAYPELRRNDPRGRCIRENETVFKVANQIGYLAPDCQGLEKLMGKTLQKCLTGFTESRKIGWFSGLPKIAAAKWSFRSHLAASR